MEPIKISVSTSQLRQLLEAEPKVYAQLESMACEKIAEEITRKLIATSGAIHKQIEDALKKEMSRYSYASSLPAAAKEAIATAVNTAITQKTDSLMTSFRNDLAKVVLAESDRLKTVVDQRIEKATDLLNKATQKALDDMIKTSADRFEKMARSSFIDVIREAKGVVG